MWLVVHAAGNDRTIKAGERTDRIIRRVIVDARAESLDLRKLPFPRGARFHLKKIFEQRRLAYARNRHFAEGGRDGGKSRQCR